MITLQEEIAAKISAGLQRRTVKSCSKWAEKYRVMGKPFPGTWSFDHHPWLLEMHDTQAEKTVGQKAAQMGYTEWAMNLTFYNMDVNSFDCLYILPTSDDAGDFSAGRFDPALELSPHLRGFFSDVNNVRLKRAGSNTLYVRGSHSRSKLKSIPTPLIVVDEMDEMPPASIALLEERQSGQVQIILIFLSTPSIDGFGINGEYILSTEEHFHFNCPLCNRIIELEFPDSLVVTAESLTDKGIVNSYLQCMQCKGKLPIEKRPNGEIYKPWLKHRDRGGTAHFIPSHSNRDVRGFHVSQFYSMARVGDPVKLAYAKLLADRDPTRAQEWWNSKGGLTYEAEGARVTEKNLMDCTGGYHSGPSSAREVIPTMGIDVGAVLHTVIKEFTLEGWMPAMAINDLASARILQAKTTSGNVSNGEDDFEEALEWFKKYGCLGVVIDAEPERRSALRFVQKIWGRALLCDYLFSQSGREAIIDEDAASIKVNRTAWMDISLGRYKNGSVQIPVDISLEFKSHIREPVRVFQEDKWGNKYGVYKNVKPDHFAHADTYAEIALPLATSIAQSSTITDLY
jgi:hypothetical protein